MFVSLSANARDSASSGNPDSVERRRRITSQIRATNARNAPPSMASTPRLLSSSRNEPTREAGGGVCTRAGAGAMECRGADSGTGAALEASAGKVAAAGFAGAGGTATAPVPVMDRACRSASC